jgi:hypothetical protein
MKANSQILVKAGLFAPPECKQALGKKMAWPAGTFKCVMSFLVRFS